jgi:ammonium transporter, Amt family
LGLSNPGLVANIFVTTNAAAAAGGIATLLVTWFRYEKPGLEMTLNGVLAGLVAITAGCGTVTPGGAIVIGFMAKILIVFAVEFFERILKIDDPVSAVSVHCVNGVFGTIMVGFFAKGDGISGLFYGGGTDLLVSQLIGVSAVAL